MSPLYHKYSINPNNFIDAATSGATELPSGYAYKPHYNIPIRVFSDFIETAPVNSVVEVPFYSYFSKKTGNFIWRDIYSYGYIDGDGIGLNIPFLNDSHYPFKEVRMIQFPVIRNVSDLETDLINDPITDDCE